MPRLSRRWWRNIAAVNFAVLTILPAGVFPADPEPMETGQTAGRVSGETIQVKFGSQEALRQNLLNPMTSSGSPLETVDGSTSFSGQLSFPSSQKFLEVFMQPGPSGDLATVIIGEDLNLDGTTDYSYQVPYPVSGVCGNGIIACVPGTWSDCRHYRWAADARGQVVLEETDLLNLGGCYCINQDCGSNLVWNNPAVVLNDLGGGVVGAIQKANPGFTVSDVRVSTTTINYYGQDTTHLRDPAGGPMASPQPPAQTVYFDNPAALTPDATVAAAAQIDAQTGLPSQLSTLVDRAGTSGQTVSCFIVRTIRIDQVQGFCQDIVGEVLSTVRDRRFFKLKTGGGTYTIRGGMPPSSVLDAIFTSTPPPYHTLSLKDFACNLTYAKTVFDRRSPVPSDVRDGSSGPVTNSPAIPTGGVYLGRSIDYGWFDNDDSGCHKDDIGFYVHDWHEVCTHTSDVATDLFQDSCAVLESDCSLQSEKVDDVTTYRQFNPTGLVPLPSTRTFPGVTSHEVTRDWWRKDRTYVCRAQGLDFSDVKTRFGAVIGSLQKSGDAASYQDQMQSPDGWGAGAGSIEMMDLPDQNECEKACKTRRPTLDTQAVLPGHSGQLKTSTDSYDLLYRSCVNDRCPTEPGEEIVKECQCLNEFAEAASIMQMLRLAGQDTICSDGVRK